MLLARDALRFLLEVGRDEALLGRAAAADRASAGLDADDAFHPEAVAPPLAELTLTAAVQQGGAPLFDALAGRLSTESDVAMRRSLLGALGRSTGSLAERVRALALEPRLKVTEASTLLWTQSSVPENREGFWSWLQASWNELAARLPEAFLARAPWTAAGFCDEARAAEVEAFFRPRVGALPGGPHELDGAVEAIRLCAALVEANRAPLATDPSGPGGSSISSPPESARGVGPIPPMTWLLGTPTPCVSLPGDEQTDLLRRRECDRHRLSASRNEFVTRRHP